MRSTQYDKLAEKIAADIEDGTLSPGMKLPTHRALAEQYGVALATATRAYKLLEQQGLISGERGRGVFVRERGLPLAHGIEQSAADGLLDLVFNMPGHSSDSDMLRGGLKRLAAAGELDTMLQYQPHGGRPHERRILATYLERTLGSINAEQLLITSGAQHALFIAANGLLRRGNRIGVDPLTYPGFKTVAALHGLTVCPIDGLSSCVCAGTLERYCVEQSLSALYVMPTVHNPLGTVMSDEMRRGLADVARRRDLLIFEDGAYAFLEPAAPSSFLELAPERTVYVGSFSKSLGTGLRLGYLITPLQHIASLTRFIRATTWNVPAIITALVTGWIDDGSLAQSVINRRQEGAKRQAVLRSELGGIEIVAHGNAGYAWLPLAKGQRAEPIVTRMSELGFALSSAEPFATTSSAPQAIRIAFGGISIEDLRTAARYIHAQITESLGARSER